MNLEVPAGETLPYDVLKAAVEKHKPAVLFLCQVNHPYTDANRNTDANKNVTTKTPFSCGIGLGTGHLLTPCIFACGDRQILS